jgi:hypothetical protein
LTSALRADDRKREHLGNVDEYTASRLNLPVGVIAFVEWFWFIP